MSLFQNVPFQKNWEELCFSMLDVEHFHLLMWLREREKNDAADKC